MNKAQTLHRMTHPGVVAVIRASSHDELFHLVDALKAAGDIGIEVTMSTPDAIGAIRTLSEKMGDDILLGVGTVLDETTTRLAILAGARFVVSPVMKTEIIRCCNLYSIPIVCGSYTPTEALTAQENGADFIKIFPADGLGPAYIRNLKAPMPQLQIIPTGGVTVDTCADFIKAGCAAVAAGSSLVKKDLIAKKDWKGITDLGRQFIENVAKARG